MLKMTEQSVSNAAELLNDDRAYLWHPMVSYNASQNPLIVTGGEGPYIHTADGSKYLDAMSGLWSTNLGYSQEALADAAYKQMRQMPFYPLSNSHEPAIRLAEKLNEWLGGDYRLIFSNSGSEANEVAFKIARQYHLQNGDPSRWKVISRYRSYHGNSMGSLAATGQNMRKYKYEPLAPGFLHVPPPDCYRCPFGQTKDSCHLECAEIYDQVINWEIPETVSAVILEPVITGGGVLVPRPEYLKRVREICDKYGVLMIVDEVICGFGRSGERFGHVKYGVQPDIVTMAKGITSGYLPLAATAVRTDLFEVFRDESDYGHLRHVNTFGGNPVSCAVALEVLNIMEAERMIEGVRALASHLETRLETLRDLPCVGDIRQFGFLAGIELVADKETKAPADSTLLAAVVTYCRERGIIIGKNGDTVPQFNNILTLCPPFVVTKAEVDQIVETIAAGIEAAVAAQAKA